MRFRLRGDSRRSRWLASGSLSHRRNCTRSIAKCAWKRHTWRFPRRASPGECRRRSRSPCSSLSPRGSHASRCVSGCAARRVTRWLAAGSLSPRRNCTRSIAKCAWKRHTWRFRRRASPGEVSLKVVESALRSRHADRMPRCVSRCAVRRFARDGSLQQTCCADCARRRSAVLVKQTIEVGVRASEDKTWSRPPPRGPSLVRAPWHRTTPARRFATPSFFVCGTSADDRLRMSRAMSRLLWVSHDHASSYRLDAYRLPPPVAYPFPQP
jgi:hypothetical protein